MTLPVLPIWHLSIDDAKHLRWTKGRTERGLPLDAPFHGDPLAELYEELIDALNYCDAHRQTGNNAPYTIHHVEWLLRQATKSTRQLLLQRHKTHS